MSINHFLKYVLKKSPLHTLKFIRFPPHFGAANDSLILGNCFRDYWLKIRGFLLLCFDFITLNELVLLLIHLHMNFAISRVEVPHMYIFFVTWLCFLRWVIVRMILFCLTIISCKYVSATLPTDCCYVANGIVLATLPTY